MNIFTAQAQFLQKAGKVVAGETEAPEDQIRMSERLMFEEFREWRNAEEVEHEVKEAIDLMYVTAQYLNSVIGPNKATRCLQAVHENNMTKVMNPEFRPDGKVKKGKGYKKLDLSTIIFEED